MKPLQSSDWKELIKPGNRVFIGSNAATPQYLVKQMLAHSKDFSDIEIVHILTLGEVPWVEKQYSDTIKTNSFFLGHGSRDAVNEGRADYTPCFLSELPGLFRDRVVPIDVALIGVSPPDEYGYCSMGVSIDVVSAACRFGSRVIAQVNPSMPRTLGESFIHVDQIDAFLEQDEPIPEIPIAEPDADTTKIGQYVAHLIEDGSTLQMGIGNIPNAVLRALQNHRHLGIHTEMFSDGLLDCIEKGVIDNSRKTFHQGMTVSSFCMGTKRLYDYVHNNPHIAFFPSEYTNSPINIARNDKMVAINSAIEVDLTGQVVADSVGFRFYSGIGGQVDFIRGSAMSKGGKPIIALPSTAKKGTVSRITPKIADGSGVVTSRGDVHYVVTEYGIATLRGRSVRERALELIQVAHPKFRDDLLREAVKTNRVPTYQINRPNYIDDLEGLEVKKVVLRDTPFVLRPLFPSDERRLQEFFYSHSVETIRMRYGHYQKRMTRERAYQLVNVDQTKDLALAIFEVQGPREEIHAVGRYYLDEDGKTAEMAFVVRESKRRLGMGRTLFDNLTNIARKRGLKNLWAKVRRDNFPMLHLFEKLGCRRVDDHDAEEERLFVFDL